MNTTVRIYIPEKKGYGQPITLCDADLKAFTKLWKARKLHWRVVEKTDERCQQHGIFRE